MTASLHPRTLLAQEIDLNAAHRQKTHAHAANEFLLILSGRGEHRTAQGEHGYRAGSLHFFPRGQDHEHRVAGSRTRGLTVRFRDEALAGKSPVDRQAADRLAFLKARAYLGLNELAVDETTARTLRRIFRLAAEEDQIGASGVRCMLKGLALQALVTVCRDPGIGYTPDRPPVEDGIVRVLSVLDAHPEAPVTVAGMAKEACLSRSHFHALFKETTGSTLIEHLTRLRVGTAARMLRHSEVPILQIMKRCGFGSPNRFYTAFRARFGMPPAAYRRRGGKTK